MVGKGDPREGAVGADGAKGGTVSFEGGLNIRFCKGAPEGAVVGKGDPSPSSPALPPPSAPPAAPKGGPEGAVGDDDSKGGSEGAVGADGAKGGPEGAVDDDGAKGGPEGGPEGAVGDDGAAGGAEGAVAPLSISAAATVSCEILLESLVDTREVYKNKKTIKTI